MQGRSERNRLVVDNLHRVAHIVRGVHARASHLSKDDFTGVGMLALVKAADSFDPSYGVPFGAYANQMINRAIKDEMRSMDWASRKTRERIREVTRQRDELGRVLGRTATVEEIASAMGVPKSAVREALDDAGRTITTIDETADNIASGDILLPEESAVLGERRTALAHAVAALPERMRAIIQAVYIDERSVNSVAEEFGVSHSAISQQRAEAIRMLRDALERHGHSDGDEHSPLPATPTRNAYFDRLEEYAKNGGPTGQDLRNDLTNR